MADKKRKLVIEILGENKQAAKALSDTESRLDRTGANLTKFGAASVAAGVAVAGGLAFAARESENAEKESRKLTNSIANSTHTYARNGDALRDLAADIQKKTAADADDIVGMQARLVQYGLTEQQVKSLTPLIVDMSRKMGVDMSTAARTVIRSIDGSAGALTRMGIQVDETRMKTDPFNATVDALAATVGGYAEEEGATFSGQLERLKNQLGDLTEGVGAGAISMVSGLADAASRAGGAVADMNPEIAESAGKIGAVAAGAMVVVGSLSMAAGKAIEMRDRFTDVGADGERSLNRIGKAAAALGALGAAYAVVDTTFALVNAAAGTAKKSAAAIDDLTLALAKAKGASKSTIDAFGDLVAAEQNTLRVQNLWQEFGDEVSIVGTGVQADIEQVQRAFDSMGDSMGPKAQLDVLDALEKATAKLDKNSDQYRKNKEFIETNRAAVEKHAAATKASSAVTSDLGDDIAEQGKKVEDTRTEWEKYSDAISASADPIFGAISAAKSLTDAKNATWNAQVKVNFLEAAGKKGTDEYAAAVRDLAAANSAQVGSAFAAESALARLASGVQSGKVSYDNFNATLDSFVQRGIISAAQAEDTRNKVAGVGWQVAALDGQRANVVVDADTTAADWKLIGFAERLRRASGNMWWATLGIPGRAAGGPVAAGQPYIVGEQGPELMIPRSAGTIVPADRTADLRRRGRTVEAGAQPIINVDLSGALVTADMAGRIVQLVEQGVAAGHRTPRLAAALR